MKQDLKKKIRLDLKVDKVMTVFSSIAVMVSLYYFGYKHHYTLFAIMFLLLWFNAALLTKRDIEILEA